MFEETTTRSIGKTISWRILATFITASLVFVFTGRVDIALTVGAFEAIVKVLFYFLHERAWNRISVGRKRVAVGAVEGADPTIESGLDGQNRKIG